MGVYVVRRSLSGIPDDAAGAALRRCREHADELARMGHHIRYLGGAYVPADGFGVCVYEASSPGVVRLATERAAVPYDEILPLVVPGAADHHA